MLHSIKDNDILKYLVNISAKTYFCRTYNNLDYKQSSYQIYK